MTRVTSTSNNTKQKDSFVNLLLALFALGSITGGYYYYYLQKKKNQAAVEESKRLVSNMNTTIATAKKNAITSLNNFYNKGYEEYKDPVNELINQYKNKKEGTSRLTDFSDLYSAQYISLASSIYEHEDDIIAPLSIRWRKANPWQGGSGLQRLYHMCGVTAPETDEIERSIFLNFMRYAAQRLSLDQSKFSTMELCVQNAGEISNEQLLKLSFETEAAVMLYTADLLYSSGGTQTTNGKSVYPEMNDVDWQSFWQGVSDAYIANSTSDLPKNLQVIVDLYYIYFWSDN